MGFWEMAAIGVMGAFVSKMSRSCRGRKTIEKTRRKTEKHTM